ncbi:hypothetical protein BOTCAL_0210g00140 [Botryotinia calthae]|uniref:Uncharacterized protein n=1 Tax=Botryotinia calthae TaxID=38488 RepID=A0A4Y8CZI8_9HELO|nr:hypothetical protein BOTCAL_0210g00140 [Botryotinia calthae]
MGNKNNRGQKQLVPMSVKIAQQQMAEKEQFFEKKDAAHNKWVAQKKANHQQWAEKQAEWKQRQLEKKQAEEQTKLEKSISVQFTKEIAATIQFECIQKHYALVLNQNGDDRELVINLNFVADPPTDMMALMKVLPEYSRAINKVQVKLIQPIQHGSRAIYNQRVQNMNKLIEQLDVFPLTELNVLVDVNSYDNFQQFKLAAAFHGLYIEDWTMEYQIMAGSDRYPIDKYSSYGKRLRGVYRTEF